jgi:hypothetical protein
MRARQKRHQYNHTAHLRENDLKAVHGHVRAATGLYHPEEVDTLCLAPNDARLCLYLNRSVGDLVAVSTFALPLAARSTDFAGWQAVEAEAILSASPPASTALLPYSPRASRDLVRSLRGTLGHETRALGRVMGCTRLRLGMVPGQVGVRSDRVRSEGVSADVGAAHSGQCRDCSFQASVGLAENQKQEEGRGLFGRARALKLEILESKKCKLFMRGNSHPGTCLCWPCLLIPTVERGTSSRSPFTHFRTSAL